MKKWKPTKKTALVTHKGCLDGTGSALMFIWAGGRRENIFFRNPSMCFLTADEAKQFDEVWFADVCPSSLNDPGGGIPFHVFDHHISNQRKFGSDERCTFDMTKSGTSLMAKELGIFDWENLTRDILNLIEALEDYDLGRFDKPMGMRLADIASSYTQDQMLDIMAQRGPEEILCDHALTQRAEALASIRNLYAEQAANRAYGFVFPDTGDKIIKCGMAVSPVYWKNEVARRILEDHDLALVVDPTTQMVSLRSKAGGPDCSIIAARYGGGGHARAAGFKANGLQMLDALTEAVIG